MKKLLILIVAIALFLHFYPQPELESWFNEQKDTALTTVSEATDTKVRLNPSKIFRDLETNFAQFSEAEQTFVKEITENRDSVKQFFNEYCDKNKLSPKLHRSNQEVVCKAINQYRSLF